MRSNRLVRIKKTPADNISIKRKIVLVKERIYVMHLIIFVDMFNNHAR